ncbi:3-phosphoshikimate 1-carboxyvinyltransferase [Roseitalea porphyridii]|uniref:3-phosphoshikimate 1-carboxyvinyltransferase n=1 Tax=Roseitalea porphyridii TaxID=1852022 RepID=A0A4P6V1K2_9HYPH|nr:3-phosphoshikimate 1-carboxyvinyltransferase [Roseitalea porphyridii]QBK30529.1 3-phosphoshikimate 1-carboxyvinyltransferase [Roseitalea porphyridii]
MSDFLAAERLTVRPVRASLRGRAVPPGSKSITNRVLLLAALANGTSRITGALRSDDTRHMATALRAMGVSVEETDATSFEISGNGQLQAPSDPLFLGNAGTATRFLTAIAASVDGTVVVDGDEHMRKRPIAPLVEALRAWGVAIEAPSGCPPVTIRGTGRLPAGRVTIDGGLSSQYVSALLMAAPLAEGPVDIVLTGDQIGARGYVDLTIAAMEAFGAGAEDVSAGHWRVSPTGYMPANHHVEPDASAATYLWAAQRLTGGAIDIGTAPDAFTQPDAKAHDLIALFPRMPAVIDGAQMQDAVPTLAVLAAYNETPVRFVGIGNLRVKECDRIAALSQGLNVIRPGLAAEEGDELVVHADPTLRGATVSAEIDTFADHRIAMSFALTGLVTDGITILDPGCVAKTFPAYWDVLAGLGVELRPAG